MSETRDRDAQREDLGPMFEAPLSAELERLDRKNPIPGGEPPCPVCQGKISRVVEAYPSPHTGSSPFRVRLICANPDCRRWTVYRW